MHHVEEQDEHEDDETEGEDDAGEVIIFEIWGCVVGFGARTGGECVGDEEHETEAEPEDEGDIGIIFLNGFGLLERFLVVGFGVDGEGEWDEGVAGEAIQGETDEGVCVVVAGGFECVGGGVDEGAKGRRGEFLGGSPKGNGL